MSSTASSIVRVYWRPGCPWCTFLRRGLHNTGLPYEEINIWSDSEAAALVRSVANGNETVPTVVVSDRALVNPSVKQVLAAVRAEAPRLADELHLPQASPRPLARLASRLRRQMAG